MATFLFWNINRKSLLQEVGELCKEHDVDILILAENKEADQSLKNVLREITGHSYTSPFNELSRKLSFFFRYSSDSILPVNDVYNFLSIRKISLSSGFRLLLSAVHLSSKLYASEDEQSYEARLAIQQIEASEKSMRHYQTLVVGDFNMNPFEPGLVDADAFHGMMTRSITHRRKRSVRRVERNFFYNPMWGKMGDNSEGPPGTYYYSGSSNREIFWNTFDQVLIRPDLLHRFDSDRLRVLTNIGSGNLLKKDKINSDFSDHLPIVFELSEEE